MARLNRTDAESGGSTDTTRRGRLKVLLVAFACSPGRGSEPKSGWSRALETQRHCDTWVICEERESRQAIENYSEGRDPKSLPRFCYVELSGLERLLARIPGLYYVAYNLWHRRAYRLAIRHHAREHFDVVHQATMCGYREPGYCWKLDAPFVWGPVGGSQNYPWKFLRFGGLTGALREGSRSVLNAIQLRFSPRINRVAHRADAVLAGNSTNQWDFERVLGVSSILMTTTGLPEIGDSSPRKATSGPLRILWSGPHNYGKGLFLLISALGEIRDRLDFRLEVLGEGRENERWRRMAKEVGIDDRCSWAGRIPFEEALTRYEQSDVFAFTSLRDTAANVVLEALAAGIPVICFDLQGARDVITAECGIRVPLVDPIASISAYGKAILTLDRDRALLRRLSDGARLRAKEFTWEKKVLDTVDVYYSVVSGSGQKARAGQVGHGGP
jgi:glycosyltransferase involved in cell wall biosynthesis